MVAKRIALVVVLALIGAGCHWLDPRPGFGPNLTVHVGPPGAAGVRAVDVSARRCSRRHRGSHDGAARRQARRVRSRPAPRCRCTSPSTSARPVPASHVFFVRSKVGDLKRRGLGVVTGGVRLNQLQALGTHNSYHVHRSSRRRGIERWQYFEDPLDVQLRDQGVRQFELDVNVATTPTGSSRCSTCRASNRDHLPRAAPTASPRSRRGRDAHPAARADRDPARAQGQRPRLPGRRTGLWDAADLDQLDAEIRSVFGRGRHVHARRSARRARHACPRRSRPDGWPEINAVRGQVMFLMDNGGTFRDWYRAGHPALEGRVIFTNADPRRRDAAFIKRNDPIGSFADIQSLIAQGYVVRTRADADTVQARANDTHDARRRDRRRVPQWVSSDFVVRAGRRRSSGRRTSWRSPVARRRAATRSTRRAGARRT